MALALPCELHLEPAAIAVVAFFFMEHEALAAVAVFFMPAQWSMEAVVAEAFIPAQ